MIRGKAATAEASLARYTRAAAFIGMMRRSKYRMDMKDFIALKDEAIHGDIETAYERLRILMKGGRNV